MKTYLKPWLNIPVLYFLLLLLVVAQSCTNNNRNKIILSCKTDNDLYRTLVENKIDCIRYNTPEEAISHAVEGAGLLILADGYPQQTTVLEASLFEKASSKKLRLYVEYPSFLPGIEIGTPRGTHWERAVISSDAFAPTLQKLRILAIHDCRFVPVEVESPDIVMGRVAGFDVAVFGLPKEVFPILFEMPKQPGGGNFLIATTKLSQFITARYAPADAWKSIWKTVLTWLRPDSILPDLNWIPSVRPSFSADEQLPAEVEKQALKRGIDWYFNSGMILSQSMLEKYNKPANLPEASRADPDLTQDWPYGHRIALKPGLDNARGDGTLGVMEGFDAKIFADGTQPARWWKRGDCNGETAGTMSAAGVALQNPNYQKVGGNIGDWLYFKSMISLGDRSNPNHQAYGLMGWTDVPEYCGPGTMNCYEVYYGDDQARNMLGIMLAAATLKTDRYDERMLKCLLANLRVTGQSGFQPDRIDQGPLVQKGWQYYYNLNSISYSGNFQAYMWSCYLWAYQQTGYDLFLKKAKIGINTMMKGYPNQWGVTGMQMDRARMVLPLAWLVRVEDTPEHRSWLRNVVDDMTQDPITGTIPERIEAEVSNYGKGHYKSPKSNEEYGTTESTIIQNDGDPCCDLLYAVNFAFIGLHEAAGATGDKYYRDAEDKLANFLCRVQIRSEKHPELDGGWFRAFDFKRWEYWASSTDLGWGAWCIESGWSQSWITMVLGLRQLNTSFWEITRNSKIGNNLDHLIKQFLPD